MGLVPLYEKQTSQFISQAMCYLLDNFEINYSGIFSVTSDQGANYKKAIRDTFGERRQVFCHNHAMALVIPVALKLVLKRKIFLIQFKIIQLN